MNVTVDVSTTSLLLPQEETWMWWCPLNRHVGARRPKWCRPPSCSTVTPRQASASPSSCWRRMNASICLCGTPRLCVVSREETLSLFYGHKKVDLCEKERREISLPPSLSRRTVEAKSYDDDGSGTPALSRRSQSLGVVLTVLLMGLTVCLLGLLLHKRERRWGHEHPTNAEKLQDFRVSWSSCCTSVVSSQRAGDPEGCQLLQEGKPSLL